MLGILTQDRRFLTDVAAYTLSFFFNGLRKSSVLSLLATDVAIADNYVTARLSVEKYHAASRVPLVANHH